MWQSMYVVQDSEAPFLRARAWSASINISPVPPIPPSFPPEPCGESCAPVPDGSYYTDGRRGHHASMPSLSLEAVGSPAASEVVMPEVGRTAASAVVYL
jgi:hypothetical protein